MTITASPFGEAFRCLYELKGAVPDPTHPDAYFHYFEVRMGQSEHVRYQFMKVERSLRMLDPEAWRDLLERAAPLAMGGQPAPLGVLAADVVAAALFLLAFVRFAPFQ